MPKPFEAISRMAGGDQPPVKSTVQVMNGPSSKSKGMLVPGNILHIYDRPQTTPPAGPNGIQRDPVLQGTVKSLSGMEYGDPLGQKSTTYSKSFDFGGREVLLPTVVGGKFLTDQQAMDRYKQTGEHLGIFDSPASADEFAQALHQSQEAVGNYYGQ